MPQVLQAAPKAAKKTFPLTPKQYFDLGYRHGLAGERDYHLDRTNIEYGRGLIAGTRNNPDSVWYNPTNDFAVWTTSHQVASDLAD